MGTTPNSRYKPENQENLIFNGAMDYWQEGTSFAAAADGLYVADLFKYNKVGAVVQTLSQSADVPNNKSAFSLDATVTTVDAAIAAGDFSVLRYGIEGLDFQRIKGRQFTLSFWVKATKVGIYCVSFQNEAQDKSYVVEYTVNSSNTWEQKEIVVTHDTTGTWNYTTGVGLRVTWAMSAGSTFQSAAGSWLSGQFFATANQVNSTDFASNIFRITQIKVNPGRGSGQFARAGKDLAEELRLIQRYLESGFSYAAGYADSTALLASSYGYYKVPKRVAPVGSAIVFTNGVWSQSGINDTGLSLNTYLNTTTFGFGVRTNNPNSRAAGSSGIMSYNWVASARF